MLTRATLAVAACRRTVSQRLPGPFGVRPSERPAERNYRM